MSNFSDIKKRLSMSTTMPASPLIGLSHGNSHHHDHKEDDEEECDEDYTNPTGSCGCGCR